MRLEERKERGSQPEPAARRDRVSVNKQAASSCPFLLESDVLSLSSSLTRQGSNLLDIPMGAQHVIHTSGVHIIDSLLEGQRLAGIYMIAAQSKIPKRDVHELLGLLNLLGALQRKRSLQHRVLAILKQSTQLLLGVRYTALTWRRTANTWTLWVAIMRATIPVTIASVVVCGLIAGSGLYPTTQTIGLASLGLSLFATSLLVHEAAHVWCIQKYHPTPVVLQRGMRLGIVHPALPPAIEVSAALAGPALGISLCLAAACICALIQQPVMLLTSCIVGVFHLGSLLPWYSDGAILLKALRGR